MTQRGDHTADQIRDELKCPSCAYSLRGLPGELVTCPECGQAINVAQLTAAQWRGPWFRAPLLNTLALPVAWALIKPMTSLIALLAHYRGSAPPSWLLLVLFASTIAGWALLLVVVSRRFGSNEGFWLALLLHVILLAYALGSVGTLSMIVKLIADLTSAPSLAIFDVMVLAVCIAAIVGGRLGERFVAFRCIRRYLRLRAGDGTMAV